MRRGAAAVEGVTGKAGGFLGSSDLTTPESLTSGQQPKTSPAVCQKQELLCKMAAMLSHKVNQYGHQSFSTFHASLFHLFWLTRSLDSLLSSSRISCRGKTRWTRPRTASWCTWRRCCRTWKSKTRILGRWLSCCRIQEELLLSYMHESGSVGASPASVGNSVGKPQPQLQPDFLQSGTASEAMASGTADDRFGVTAYTEKSGEMGNGSDDSSGGERQRSDSRNTSILVTAMRSASHSSSRETSILAPEPLASQVPTSASKGSSVAIADEVARAGEVARASAIKSSSAMTPATSSRMGAKAKANTPAKAKTPDADKEKMRNLIRLQLLFSDFMRRKGYDLDTDN